MMMSVSILGRSTATAGPATEAKGCLSEAPDVGDEAGHGGRGGHRGTGKMCACVRSLAPDEVAVGRGQRARQGRYPFAVGCHAHAAAGLAPVETGVPEYLRQSFRLGLALHLHRTWHDP